MGKIGNWFRRFMAGRYGTDKLNTLILGVGLVLCLASIFVPLVPVRLILVWGSYLFMGIAISAACPAIPTSGIRKTAGIWLCAAA